MWVYGFCYTEKKSVSFLRQGARAQKIAEFPVYCAQPTGKALLQTDGANGKCTLRKCAFWRSQSTRYQMGDPNPKIGFQKFISFVLPDVEKFAKLFGEIIFKIQPKVMAEISPENMGPRAYTISIEMNHNYVSARSRWQIHKCVGSGLCCSEKCRKFLTREEPQPKRQTSDILRTAYIRKSFSANQYSPKHGKCTLRRCTYLLAV